MQEAIPEPSALERLPALWIRLAVPVVLAVSSAALLYESDAPHDDRLGNLGRGFALLSFLFAYLWVFRPLIRRYNRWFAGTPRSPGRQARREHKFDLVFVIIVGMYAASAILQAIL
jgi:hypothetical protein